MPGTDPFPMLSNSAMSDPFSQNVLSSSITSLSASISSKQSSHVSKTYRQASTLFLTRRLPEALTTLQPLITPPQDSQDGEPAPVARSSRTTRTKVWSLYLTILNAIIELEPEEGKDAFGQQEWRALCNKVRDGEVWEEVVRSGYHGVEGDVDSDVVVNLATLLLAHGRDQLLNQKRLETYLAECNTPNLDIDAHLSQSPRTNRFRSGTATGAKTPRDLNSRVKILELYTLHVLLRNNEWEYAREFISMSPDLDEERREAFLQALQSLQEEQEEQERLEREERQRQEDMLKRELEEAKRVRAENEEKEKRRLEEERARRQAPTEIDYGVEDAPSLASPTKTRSARSTPDSTRSSRPPRSSISKGNSKAKVPQTFTARAALIFTRLRGLVDQLAANLNSNPVLLMRLMVFIMGFLIMMGSKTVREKVKRAVGAGWDKVKATAGMGTKVSYI